MIDFYSVFGGLNVENFTGELFLDIENLLLKNYEKINADFNFNAISSYALNLLAKNSRKKYSILRKISHFKGLSIMQEMLNLGILKLEKSKEEKFFKDKRYKLKKDLRSYVIQDKLVFKDNFTRFFFRFLKSNEKLILKGEFDIVLNDIKLNLEHYQSFCFEQLACEYLEEQFQVLNVQSYWNKELELDVYYKDENLCFIGEVKFKHKKICKNILNQLKFKAKRLNLTPDYYILFSKNGFSEQFDKSAEKNVLLYDLNAFKKLI
ncbi:MULTISPECIES: DUF234 domain-containing protein [unclassified Campylobacter]|uniref:DUF234 domain-containing protein n=1 Tax=unclassified Campylobacter TaxID=2593542 RepID=UPI001CC20191|nr:MULTISPECIES: DUF234 domain-containing protein [unclassified Campylobacter]